MTLEAFQNWVIQTGLMVSLLIIVILMIRRPFAKIFGANAAYALWSLPLIRLFLPALSVPQSWIPGYFRRAADPERIAPVSNASMGGIARVLDSPDVLPAVNTGSADVVSWQILVIALWLSVAAIWLGFQIFQQYRFKSDLQTDSSLPNSNLLAQIDHAVETVGLGRRPNVRVSKGEIGPLVTGVVNPLVIVPNNFAAMFDGPQQHFALVHEFAHIKRGDLWAALATLIFRAVNWPNPLVHFAANKMRGDQEAACDAFVVKVTGGLTAHSYAETLVKAVRGVNRSAQPNMHLALSLTDADADTDTEISKGD